MGKKVQPGESHNRLTAVRLVSSHKSVWLWNCQCGAQVEASSYQVRNGSRTSCGCLKREKVSRIVRARNKKPEGEPSKNTLYLGLKAAAKKRKLVFEFDRADIDEITQQPCYYCGRGPSNELRVRWNEYLLLYNGLDRVDSEVGYTKDNVVPCCKFCNQAKNNLSQEQFFDLIRRIHSTHNL